MNTHTHFERARFDVNPMTEDQLRAKVPSVFATTAHESRSERFKPIPTIEIIRGLAAEGFVVVNAKQAVARVADRAPFTKHLLRLRHVDPARTIQVNDTVAEILLKNANDGTSIYDLFAGLFRVRCLNSMVADLGDIGSVKVRHTGNVMDKVIEGTYSVLEDSKRAMVAPDAWSRQQLAPPEREAFAAAAHVLRFGDANGEVKTPITADQLLIPRRVDDRANDLWTTFNVVQENAIRGGLHGMGRDANGHQRRVTTRAVNGIDQDVKLNKALWMLAERMAQIKTAA